MRYSGAHLLCGRNHPHRKTQLSDVSLIPADSTAPGGSIAPAGVAPDVADGRVASGRTLNRNCLLGIHRRHRFRRGEYFSPHRLWQYSSVDGRPDDSPLVSNHARYRSATNATNLAIVAGAG